MKILAITDLVELVSTTNNISHLDLLRIQTDKQKKMAVITYEEGKVYDELPELRPEPGVALIKTFDLNHAKIQEELMSSGIPCIVTSNPQGFFWIKVREDHVNRALEIIAYHDPRSTASFNPATEASDIEMALAEILGGSA